MITDLNDFIIILSLSLGNFEVNIYSFGLHHSSAHKWISYKNTSIKCRALMRVNKIHLNTTFSITLHMNYSQHLLIRRLN